MSSCPQHEQNMKRLFELTPRAFKQNLKTMGLDVDNHFNTWNYDDLVEIMSEIIIYLEITGSES